MFLDCFDVDQPAICAKSVSYFQSLVVRSPLLLAADRKKTAADVSADRTAAATGEGADVALGEWIS
jgi:hypothetical protein